MYKLLKQRGKEIMLYSRENTEFNRKRSSHGDGWWLMECVVCGDEFDSNQSYAKYCSQRCANDASIVRRKAKSNAKRDCFTHCVVCGKEIEQDSTSKIRRYCSNACKQRAYRANKPAVAPFGGEEERLSGGNGNEAHTPTQGNLCARGARSESDA